MSSPSPSPSPPASICCTACQMFSYSAASFSGHDTCNTCRQLARLEARITELESRFHTLDMRLASDSTTAPLASVDAPVSSSPSELATEPAAPSQQGQWFTVRRPSRKTKPHEHHQPLHVSNRFSPLSSGNNPNQNKTLVIGASTVRNVKLATPSAIVTSISGARASDIESYLKLLVAKQAVKYPRIVIHTGTNDVRLRQSEITKTSFISLCRLAQTMSDSVTFSGPIPINRGEEMFSRIFSLNQWLSGWCSDNNVGFIDNFSSFRGKPGLLNRDGIHPSRVGAELLSRNIDRHLNSACP